MKNNRRLLRMQRIFLILVAASMLAPPPAQAARRVDIQDRIDVPVTDVDGKPLSFADTRRVILLVARQRDWKVKSDEPGMIRLEYTYRRGNAGAAIEVPYRAGSYSVIYAGSHGMAERDNGKRRTIKSAYLQWTRNLVTDIERASKLAPDQQLAPQPRQEAADDPDDKDDK